MFPELEAHLTEARIAAALEPLKHAIGLILDQLRDMELRLQALEKGR